MKNSKISAVAISLVLMTGAINTVAAKSIQMGSTSLTCSSNADCKKKCEAKGDTWKPNPGGSTWGTCTKKKASFGQRGIMTSMPLSARPMLKTPPSALKPTQYMKPRLTISNSKVLLPRVNIKTPVLNLKPKVKRAPTSIKLQPRRGVVLSNKGRVATGMIKPNKGLIKPVVGLKQQPTLIGFGGLKASPKPIINRGLGRGLKGGFMPTQGSASQLSRGADIYRTAPPQSGFIEKEISIPLQVLADKVEAAFQGTKIRLNNYGSRHGNSWYKGNDSYVELPSRFGVPKTQFSFPAMNALPVRYYINDVNLASVQAEEAQGKLKVGFNFESSGKEIKGHCSNSYKCVLGNDLSVPDIQMNHAKANISLTPTLYYGSVSFSHVEVDFVANIQAQGGCDVIVLRSICNLIDYKSMIKNNAKSAIKNMIDNARVRDLIALEMRILLASQDVRNIQSVEVFGRMLVIKYRQMFGQMAR